MLRELDKVTATMNLLPTSTSPESRTEFFGMLAMVQSDSLRGTTFGSSVSIFDMLGDRYPPLALTPNLAALMLPASRVRRWNIFRAR